VDGERILSDVLNKLGKPNFASMASEIQKHCGLSRVLRKSKVRVESGRFTSIGGNWEQVEQAYSFREQEFDKKSPFKIMEMVEIRRVAALIEIAEKLESLLKSKSGYQFPEECNAWHAFVLRGWWLRESIERNIGWPIAITVTITCVCSFARMSEVSKNTCT
jgi:hypothetical protein